MQTDSIQEARLSDGCDGSVSFDVTFTDGSVYGDGSDVSQEIDAIVRRENGALSGIWLRWDEDEA
jgi:hypothetical protein